MKLNYVGDMPKVSKSGVSFDHSKPDKYTYLTAVVELLEALSYGETKTTNHLYRPKLEELNSSELLSMLKKFCPDLDKVFDTRDEKAKILVQDLKDRVEENDSLESYEKIAWLNNIDMMTDYYLQYVTNKSAYEAALDALAKEIQVAKVKEVSVPLFRNYGIVLNDLKNVLTNQKVPIDSNIEVTTTDRGLLATIKFFHSAK
jgi:hypothetical protein